MPIKTRKIRKNNLICLMPSLADTILPSLILAAGMIVVIYGGYFAASYHACKKVIKEK